MTTTSAAPIRLNRLIELWEQGKPVFGGFARFRDVDGALYYASSQQDFVIYDLEHSPADFTQFRTFLQFMVDRGSVLAKGNAQPNVVPLARIPPNCGERNQWIIKQVLDMGAYGLLAPHVKNSEDMELLISSARYPHHPAPAGAPPRDRGASPQHAARYWGISIKEYLERADAWPLAPRGELALIAMIESREGVANVARILEQNRGIAAVQVGSYDLSSSLGHPWQVDHPETEQAVQAVLAATKESGVPCGIAVTRNDIEQRIQQGFRMLIAVGSPGEIEETIRLGRRLASRD